MVLWYNTNRICSDHTLSWMTSTINHWTRENLDNYDRNPETRPIESILIVLFLRTTSTILSTLMAPVDERGQDIYSDHALGRNLQIIYSDGKYYLHETQNVF